MSDDTIEVIEVREDILFELYKIALRDQLRTRDRVAFRAITEYICLMCSKTHSHRNTNIPNYCPNCTSDLFAMDMKGRLR